MSGDDFKTRAMAQVKAMWNLYLVDRTPEDVIASFDTIPDNVVVFGTGRHEFYRGREEYVSSFTSEQIEVRDIRFTLIDEWYEAQDISDDVCVVYVISG